MLVFDTEASGDEDLVSRDLMHALLRLKVPSSAMSLGSSGSEHMDVSTLLSIDWHVFSETISSAGNISIFCYTVFEILGKYKAKIVLKQNKIKSKELVENLTYDDVRKEIESFLARNKDDPQK